MALATPACADAVCVQPSIFALDHMPAPWAACPRVRSGRICVTRFMSGAFIVLLSERINEA